MATCKQCGAGTQLYSNGIPICLACSDHLEAKTKPATNDVQLSLPHE
jgi:hypothetical protein